MRKRRDGIMVVDFEVELNLYYLKSLLCNLEHFHLDEEIRTLIQNFIELIDEKIYSSYSFQNYEIEDIKVIERFYLKKNIKKD